VSLLVHAARAKRVCLDNFIPSPEAVACLAEPVARRLLCVPLARCANSLGKKDELLIASVQPDDAVLLERVARQLPIGMAVRFVLADEPSIRHALEKCYTHLPQGQDLLSACSAHTRHDAKQVVELNATVRLVEAILLCATRERASDIHISPSSDGVRVRFRIDGVLCKRSVLRKSFYTELVGRIKIMAHMDIAVARQPQDGQFNQFIDNELIDFRTSVFPTISGENIVIRVLRPSQSQYGIESLELPENLQHQLLSCLHKPSGLIVFCGPTGSGKSTSIHALLSELDQDALNIMTLEDPVEKLIIDVQQTSIDPTRSLGYAEGLRALMRQDPDVLLIGEVRDASSCQMMLRAVMTGHSVLTTVHARNVFGAIDRIVELGVDRNMLASHLLCIAAQRLIRKRCYRCSGLDSNCTVCRGAGFYGRQALVELLVITPEIAALIGSAAEHRIILAEAEVSGFVPLHQQGELLVQLGISTSREMQRVLGA
jgi:type II secretory ATPase GspE/PulE/Tfp pilus assembly ATPase PilB-like protein